MADTSTAERTFAAALAVTTQRGRRSNVARATFTVADAAAKYQVSRANVLAARKVLASPDAEGLKAGVLAGDLSFRDAADIARRAERAAADPPPRYASKPDPRRTIHIGNNREVLRGLNSDTADLIYLDPPFNSNRDYKAPVGSEAADAEFEDTWTLSKLDRAEVGLLAEVNPPLASFIMATQQVSGDSMMSYLTMMAVRLIEMRRVLKPDGSIWLHCDPTAGAYLKVLMDSIFGKAAFRNEVTWRRSTVKGTRGTRRSLGSVTDRILFYGASDAARVTPPRGMPEVMPAFPHGDDRGRYRAVTPLKGDRSLHVREGMKFAWNGMDAPHGWRASRENLDRLQAEDRIHYTSTGQPYRKQYEDEYDGVAVGDLWTDIPIAGREERVGYPTQKPVALVERIIEASCPDDGLVLDPFCGCATACIAAEKKGRRWIGIDISEKAAELVARRMAREVPDSELVWWPKTMPRRTDVDKPVHYRKRKHELFGRQEGVCNGCGVPFPFRNLTVDHDIPQSRNGTDDLDNLQLLCGACNSEKGTRTMAEWNAARMEVSR